MSKFLAIKVIDSWRVLDQYRKKLFWLNIAGIWKEFVILFKRTLAIICIIIKDLAFSLI